MTSALCQTERQTVSQTGGREIADDSFKTAKNGSVRVTAVKIPHAGGVVNELKLSLVYFQIKRLAEVCNMGTGIGVASYGALRHVPPRLPAVFSASLWTF